MKTQKIVKTIFGDTEGNGQKDGRLQGGDVPRVNFNRDSGKVYVNADNPQNANDNVRFRREVSRN